MQLTFDCYLSNNNDKPSKRPNSFILIKRFARSSSFRKDIKAGEKLKQHFFFTFQKVVQCFNKHKEKTFLSINCSQILDTVCFRDLGKLNLPMVVQF
jgi:hypothetical protein